MVNREGAFVVGESQPRNAQRGNRMCSRLIGYLMVPMGDGSREGVSPPRAIIFEINRSVRKLSKWERLVGES